MDNKETRLIDFLNLFLYDKQNVIIQKPNFEIQCDENIYIGSVCDAKHDVDIHDSIIDCVLFEDEMMGHPIIITLK